MDAVQLDMFADDKTAMPLLLSRLEDAKENENGVVTENVLEFREGLIPHNCVSVKIGVKGFFIVYEFGYMYKNYGAFHPLCEPHYFRCHRRNTSRFLADCILNDFKHSYMTADCNIDKAGKKVLIKLCEKMCDNIAKEVA